MDKKDNLNNEEEVYAVPGPAIIITKEEYKSIKKSENSPESIAKRKQMEENAKKFTKNNIVNKEDLSR